MGLRSVFQPFGRFEESAAEMRRAVELDPLNVIWRGVLMAHLGVRREVRGGAARRREGAGYRAKRDSPASRDGRGLSGHGKPHARLASAEQAHRNLPQQSMGTGFLAAMLVRPRTGRRAPSRNGRLAHAYLGRAWYTSLCSELEAAAEWYEKMIEAREVFAPVYANSLYTEELRGVLVQARAHDEPAGIARLSAILVTFCMAGPADGSGSSGELRPRTADAARGAATKRGGWRISGWQHRTSKRARINADKSHRDFHNVNDEQDSRHPSWSRCRRAGRRSSPAAAVGDA